MDRNTNNPTKTIRSILKKIFTRKLAIEFTTVRKSGSKIIFNTCKIYKILKGKFNLLLQLSLYKNEILF